MNTTRYRVEKDLGEWWVCRIGTNGWWGFSTWREAQDYAVRLAYGY